MAGKVVVAGASGLVGGAAVKLFADRPGWEVVALSRRPPFAGLGGARHVALDLLDADACRAAADALGGTTHLVYAAVNEAVDNIFAGWSDPVQIGRNRAMLENLFAPLAAASPGLRHVSLVHGAKAYGTHIPGQHLPTPMRETIPRLDIPNFYYEQEDYLRAQQRARAAAGRPFAWTVFRPVMIAGDATGANMNPFLVLALFGALCKEAGIDMPMPEGPSIVVDATDADLIAEALAWAAEAPGARDQVFNLSNGDIFAMHDAFPVVADCLGIRLAAPRPVDIVAEIGKLAHLWPGMVRRHGLKAPEDLGALLGTSLQVAGGWTLPAPHNNPLFFGVVSTIKVRQAGFHGCIDTLAMIAKYVRRYQELGLIP